MHEEGPSFKDIVGGLGWFLGLFGIAALLRGRKNGNA
jgi:nickel transport protein